MVPTFCRTNFEEGKCDALLCIAGDSIYAFFPNKANKEMAVRCRVESYVSEVIKGHEEKGAGAEDELVAKLMSALFQQEEPAMDVVQDLPGVSVQPDPPAVAVELQAPGEAAADDSFLCSLVGSASAVLTERLVVNKDSKRGRSRHGSRRRVLIAFSDRWSPWALYHAWSRARNVFAVNPNSFHKLLGQQPGKIGAPRLHGERLQPLWHQQQR